MTVYNQIFTSTIIMSLAIFPLRATFASDPCENLFGHWRGTFYQSSNGLIEKATADILAEKTKNLFEMCVTVESDPLDVVLCYHKLHCKEGRLTVQSPRVDGTIEENKLTVTITHDGDGSYDVINLNKI